MLLRAVDQECPDGWSTVPLERGVVASVPGDLDNGDLVQLRELFLATLHGAAAAHDLAAENTVLHEQLDMLLSESDGAFTDESSLATVFGFLDGARVVVLRDGAELFNSGIDQHTIAIESRRSAGATEHLCAIANGQRMMCASGPYLVVVDVDKMLTAAEMQLVRITVARLAERRGQRELHGLIERLWLTVSDTQPTAPRVQSPDLDRLENVESDFRTMLDNTFRDSLTQAYNRSKTQAVLADLAKASDPFSVVLLDIDHFKSVNDTWGHPAGDRVIVDVVAAIGEMTRADDVIARWGGEEFLVILPRATLSSAAIIAERMRVAIESQVSIEERRITCSLGVAQATSADTEELIARADAALYRAKDNGRNQVMADDGQEAAA